jgi:hypothetical protein
VFQLPLKFRQLVEIGSPDLGARNLKGRFCFQSDELQRGIERELQFRRVEQLQQPNIMLALLGLLQPAIERGEVSQGICQYDQDGSAR